MKPGIGERKRRKKALHSKDHKFLCAAAVSRRTTIEVLLANNRTVQRFWKASFFFAYLLLFVRQRRHYSGSISKDMPKNLYKDSAAWHFSCELFLPLRLPAR